MPNAINAALYVNEPSWGDIARRCDGAMHAKETQPSLCDINMPGMSGIDLLEKVKAEDILLHTPIIMLSSSDDERDIRQCYQNGAASYMCKPNNFQDLCAFVRSFSEYWIESISLPKRLNVGGTTDVG